MDNLWNNVYDFHLKFGHPYEVSPKILKSDRVRKRYEWMLEELNEFIVANNICDQTDAMIDLIYFALGTLVEIGVKPNKIFEIVHEANMEKLWPDGKPHYNKDGKTIKPKSWEDPFNKIKTEIDKQLSKAIRTSNHYDIIYAEQHLCVAAILEIIINKYINNHISQYEIAEYFGLCIPPTYNCKIKNIKISDTPNMWGIKIKDEQLNRFFKHYSIPLKEDYIPIAKLSDSQFEDIIENSIEKGHHLVCGYSYGFLNNKSELNDLGHVSIISSISSHGLLTILDPGPHSPGFKEVMSYNLYLAIKNKNDGLWIISNE